MNKSVDNGTLRVALNDNIYNNIPVIEQLKNNNISNALDVEINLIVTQDNVSYLYDTVKLFMEKRYIDKYDKTKLNSLYLFRKNKTDKINMKLYLRGKPEDKTYIALLKELSYKNYVSLTNELIITYDKSNMKYIESVLDELNHKEIRK